MGLFGRNPPQLCQRSDGDVKQAVKLLRNQNRTFQKFQTFCGNRCIFFARIFVDLADLTVLYVHRVLLLILLQTPLDLCDRLLRISTIKLLLNNRIHHKRGGHRQLILLLIPSCRQNNSNQKAQHHSTQQNRFCFLLHARPPNNI